MGYEKCFSFLSGRKKNTSRGSGGEDALKKASHLRFALWGWQALFDYIYYSILRSHRHYMKKTETRIGQRIA